jgi:hypothetical protein
MTPTTDNCCTRLGWIEYRVDAGGYDLHISVDPEADTDDRFKAFCHDEQEMIWVNGWSVTLEKIED